MSLTKILNWNYDGNYDLLCIEKPINSSLKESKRIGKDIILSFDDNLNPVALKIQSCSNHLRVHKEFFQRPLEFQIDIEVDSLSIQLKINLLLYRENEVIRRKRIIKYPNRWNLPHKQVSFQPLFYKKIEKEGNPSYLVHIRAGDQ